MTEQRVEGIIPAPVEKVWALLREFGDLRRGNIHGTVLEGEGVGCVRVFTAPVVSSCGSASRASTMGRMR
jgi:hypothetical protein